MPTLTLEEILAKLQRVGSPRLMFSGGWSCAVEITTPARGTDYTIRSEFGHMSPYAAAKECAQRVEKALFPKS